MSFSPICAADGREFTEDRKREHTMEKQLTENKMGVMPVGRLLFNMAGPMIVSMLVQALYNVVDSMFVARINENALAALSLAFPMQNLMIAVGTGLGVGMNAMISRSLGEGRNDWANRYAMQGVLLQGIGYLLFLCIGLFGARPFIAMQAGGIEQITDYGTTYLMLCCVLSFGFFLQMTMERILQSTGRTMLTMITQSVGAVINIILDPILIFGLLGAPQMGVAGAAVATVIGQCIAGGLAIFFNLTRNHDVRLHIRLLRPHRESLLQILAIGVPSVLMVSIGSIMTFCVNKILIAFTSTAVAVFGVYFKLQSFVFMPVFGLNNGLVPIVAYNYGARKRERMEGVIRLAFRTAVCIMIVGFLIFQLMPEQLLLLFGASSDMLGIGVPALRIISISFLAAGICVVAGSICQALGRGLYSLLISFGRQIVVLVPAAFLLSRLGVLNLVWLAWPIAEVASILLSLFFVRRTLRILDWTASSREA